MKALEPHLVDIKAPTLLVQATGDPVVNSEETALLFDRIGAKEKQYLPFGLTRHGILAGEGSEKVHEASRKIY